MALHEVKQPVTEARQAITTGSKEVLYQTP
jgi:hypothetical protein